MSWNGSLVEWTEGKTACLSVVFSWQLQEAYQRTVWLKAEGYEVHVGGPAVAYEAAQIEGSRFEGLAIAGWQNSDALRRHNPNATFTSRGCIRHCSFCTVPVIEGELTELQDWEIKPIVCDNNFLACSQKHFDNAIDRLKLLRGVDFNQGLDARLLLDYHARRLAELDLSCVRLAWDNTHYETQFLRAFQKLRRAGFPARVIRAYVLIGFDDTPEDALYRLETVKALGSRPNPMRYQPLDAQRRNEYIAPGWTDRELKRYMRYWSRQRWLEHIPFEEYRE